ncbi:hypothetical protein CEXT_171011 [Caerostris extrusa]|uniref:Uncharacterized protein n=1 Tax=Caerostris extrusa TaxID=172846 RepID=A0AAV4XTF0_CAEEX|nr:hypothetical protein CEXT_171011 [Caerostris extrusa]
MRIAASKLPFLPKRGVPQSHCISSVYLYLEDTMFENGNFYEPFLFLDPPEGVLKSNRHKETPPQQRNGSAPRYQAEYG